MKVSVGLVQDVVEGKSRCVKTDQAKVILFKRNGQIFAYENRCTHLGLSLEKGKVDNGIVKCFFHGAEFDVTTGQCVGWVDSVVGVDLPSWSHKMLSLGKSPTALKSYPVVIEGDQVFVEL